MPLARVVSFDGVSSDRMAEMQREMQGSERPDNVPAGEIIVLHDPEAEKSLVIVFFETDDDYQRGADQLVRLGLTLDDVRCAAWWVDRGGRTSRGHVAIARALRAAPGWPSVVGRVLLLPPFRWLAAGAYPLIARWRHRLPGGTP